MDKLTNIRLHLMDRISFCNSGETISRAMIYTTVFYYIKTKRKHNEFEIEKRIVILEDATFVKHA